jgi:transcriptional regulator with XRE-family HTH domain
MPTRRDDLAQRRRSRGLSQEALAAKVGVDPKTVRRWESGETRSGPQPWHRTTLAHCLDVDPAQLDVLLSPTAKLRDGDGHYVGSPREDLRPESSRDLLEPFSTDLGSDLGAMNAFRSADQKVGGGHLYAAVSSYLHSTVAPRLFGFEGVGSRGHVFGGATALTEMAGWMAHDAGHHGAARRHFERAVELSQVTNDPQLKAHVLASASHLAHHDGRAQQAISLADQGCNRLSESTQHPEIVARLLAMQARGAATSGKSVECARLLISAESVLANSPGSGRSPWTSGFDEASLASEAARCLYRLGDFRQARSQAERIIELRSEDRQRSRAFGHLMLAKIFVSAGEIEGACHASREALSGTQALGSFIVVEKLTELGLLLKPYRASRIVREFLEHLAQSLAERPWLQPRRTRAAFPRADGC